jgi:hypothetical protein
MMWGNLLRMKLKIFSFGKLISILSVLAFASACESPSQTDLNSLTGTTASTPTPTATPELYGAPETLSIFGGSNQNGVISTTLPNPLTVRVVDVSGRAVPNIPVTFTVISGGGLVNPTISVTTDSSGLASATATLGNSLGSQVFRATMPNGTVKTVTFTQTAAASSSTVAAAPDMISIFSGNSQNGTVNTVLTNPISARVTDSSGVPVPNVSVTFAAASGGAVTTANPVFTDSTGIASASIRLGTSVGTQIFTATMASGSTTSVAYSMNALAAPSYLRIVAASPVGNSTSFPSTTVPVGTTVNLRTILVDGSGAYIKDIASTWYTSGSLLPGNLSATNPSATSSLTATTSSTGTIQAIVSDSALISSNNIVSTSAVSGIITANAVAANNAVSILSGNSQSAIIGTTLTNPLSVKVVDGSNNPVSGVAVTFAAVTGAGTIVTSPATVTTDSSGVASATVRLGISLVGTQTFTATIPAGTSTSVTFNINSLATPSYLKIVPLAGTSSIPDTGYYVGDVVPFRTILVDSSGAFIKEVAANWSIGGTLSPSNLSITGGNPSKYGNYSPTAQGSGTIQAIVNDSTLISDNNIVSTTTTTGTLTITLPLIADSISVFSGNNQTGQVGTNLSSNLVVKVVNVANVAVPGVNVTFAVAGGGGQIISAQPIVTDASGLASCTVRFGGTVGASGQSFTATMPTGSTKVALFTASGTVGPSNQLSFTQQPAGANSSTAFSTQPIVQIQDSYGNVNTNDSSTVVTLTRQTGTGALGGTLTATAVAGVATFTNVSYNTAEAGVSLRASATGLTATNSSTFTVGAITLNAQCLANGAGWNTVDGGCKDLSTGLVWSAISGSTMTWHQAVWAQATSGSTTAEPWETVRGLTFDYSGTGVNYDSNASAYCHDLTESGLTDWRMPTLSEANAAYTDGSSTALKNASTAMWTASVSNSTQVSNYNLSTSGSSATQNMTSSLNTRCVRQPPPTQLLVTTQVSGGTYGLGTNVAFAVQPVIRIADSTNSTTTYATNAVTLTVTSGAGQLCNTVTTTGVTSSCASSKTVSAVNGVATFSNLSYSGTGSVTLTASATGLTSVTLTSFTVNATYPKANCLLVGGVWINSGGGCKDTTTGLIYNHSSWNGYGIGPFQISWHDYIWDQNSVGGNAGTQESSDAGRTNDYDFGTTYAAYNQNQGLNTDSSSINYCHNLQESGKTDWMPQPYEYGIVQLVNQGKAPATYLDTGGITATYHWTSLVVSGTTTSAYAQHTGNAASLVKTLVYSAICTRRDPAASLSFTIQPAGGAYGFGSGVVWATQPVVSVNDADGAGPLFYDNTLITLTVAPAADTTGGTGKLILYNGNAIVPEGTTYNGMTVAVGGQSVSLQAVNGRATFSGLSYTKKGGEKFRLIASGTSSWQGNNTTLTTVTSGDLTVPALYSISQCNVQAGWTSEYGGCRDTQTAGGTGVVWSNVMPAGLMTWQQAIWDSALTGEDAVDADDGARTSDYDTVTYPPLTGVDNIIGNYCHRLNLNGYTDWRMPTWNELAIGTGSVYHNGYTALNNSGASVGCLWSSSTVNATPTAAYYISQSTGSAAGNFTAKGAASCNVRCVRPATP